MIQANWNRAIVSSVNSHFVANKGANHLYLEGETPNYSKSSWAELRLNGPDFFEGPKNQYRVTFSIDIMCSAQLNQNIYVLQSLVGHFQSIANDIQIYQLSGSSLNLASPFFCARRVSGPRTIQWGQVKSQVDLRCTSIEADYEGEFQWPLST